MSRRKTVELNLEFANAKIKEIFRHNIIFCEKMGRAQNWVTDWNRTPKPKNLPSPEEAAKMCGILQVEPEEILAREEDVVLVRNIIEKNKPFTQEGEGLSEPWMIEAITLLRQLLPENQKQVFDFAQALLKIQESAGGQSQKDF